MCDETIETTKVVPTKTFLRKSTSTNFCILLVILLISIALLIAASIYCYLIKYKSKQKHLSQCYVTNDKLKEVLY